MDPAVYRDWLIGGFIVGHTGRGMKTASASAPGGRVEPRDALLASEASGATQVAIGALSVRAALVSPPQSRLASLHGRQRGVSGPWERRKSRSASIAPSARGRRQSLTDVAPTETGAEAGARRSAMAGRLRKSRRRGRPGGPGPRSRASATARAPARSAGRPVPRGAVQHLDTVAGGADHALDLMILASQIVSPQRGPD